MKLDKRILTGKTYLDCSDTSIATEFVGTKCYFGEDNTDFEDISKLTCTMLYSVDNSSAPYNYYKGGILYSTGFILPCAWVRELEKKYRPFTNEEFVDLFDSGKFRSIRLKDSSTQRLERLIITDIYVQGDYLYAKLNSSTTGYSPEYFFSNCEYLDGKEWKPFGVEE